jgi:hypothetical protein
MDEMARDEAWADISDSDKQVYEKVMQGRRALLARQLNTMDTGAQEDYWKSYGDDGGSGLLAELRSDCEALLALGNKMEAQPSPNESEDEEEEEEEEDEDLESSFSSHTLMNLNGTVEGLDMLFGGGGLIVLGDSIALDLDDQMTGNISRATCSGPSTPPNMLGGGIGGGSGSAAGTLDFAGLSAAFEIAASEVANESDDETDEA